jgi:flagellar basal body-associated protein FliL
VTQIPAQPSFQAPSFEPPPPAPPSFPTPSYEPPAPSYQASTNEPSTPPPPPPSEAPGPSWSTFGGQPADPVPPQPMAAPTGAPQYPSGPPTIGQPAVGPVTGGQPAVPQPAGVGQPAFAQPGVGQPGVGQPGVGQPYAPVPSPPTYDPAAMAQPYSVQPYSVAPASGAYPYGVPSAIPMVEPKRRRTGVVVLSILTTLFVLAAGVMTTLFVLTKQERDRLDAQNQRLGVETTDQRQNISTIQTNLENARRDLADSQAETKEVADQKAKLSACIKAFQALILELNKTNPSTTVINRLYRAFVRACNEADRYLDD